MADRAQEEEEEVVMKWKVGEVYVFSFVHPGVEPWIELVLRTHTDKALLLAVSAPYPEAVGRTAVYSCAELADQGWKRVV